MLLFLCVVSLACAEELVVLSRPAPLPPLNVSEAPFASPFRYHERVGVPEAARLRAAETSRVSGGLASYLGEHKFFAGLIITLTNGQTSICGGSLVSGTRVLTAASCYYDGYYQAHGMLVVLGSVRLFSGGTRVSAPAIAVHPQYNYRTIENNVAVLTIPYVATTSYIRPISLSSTNPTYAGYTAEIIGFGKTSESSSITTSQGLRDAFVPVLTNTVCSQTYGSQIKPEHVCTGGAGSRGACGGDVGGPLILYSNQGNDLLIGVVSFWSSRGCSVGDPSGHTRVGHHYYWIRAQM